MKEVEVVLLTVILFMNIVNLFRGWEFDKRLIKLEQTVDLLIAKIGGCK